MPVRSAVAVLVTTLSFAAHGAIRVRTTEKGRDVVTVTQAAPGRQPIIVEFDGAATPERFAAFARDLAKIDRDRLTATSTEKNDTVITDRYSRVFSGAAVTANDDAVARIRALDYVAGVYPDREMTATIEYSSSKIRVPEVWSTFGTRGKDIVVAVIDTGIDYSHPAFGNGFGAGHRVAGGWDFANNDADPMDDNGHGTHVAGIIGGDGGGVVGVAPEVTLLAYKVLDAGGSSPESRIITAVERAVDPNQDGNPIDHVDVINLSLGGPGFPSDPLSKAVDNASAAGAIVCVAAGNDGRFNSIGSPANAPSAITVGASSDDDELANFSSKGPVMPTLAVKPDVLAPGVGIQSAQAGGGIVEFDGTSMAAPHVAGVAALLRAIHHDWPVAHIKSAIVGTAEPLDLEAMAAGSGRVDALRAATADVLAIETSLSLGADDSAAAHWTPSATLTLVNRGTVTRSLSLESPATEAGIGVSFDATSFDLAPGATRVVHVSFDIDNAQVAAPQYGSLAYSGVVHITGGAVPLRVPWAFVKAAAVLVHYDRAESYDAFFVSTTKKFATYASTNGGGQDATAMLPLDTYDVIVIAAPALGDTRGRILVKERQALSGSVTMPFSGAAATLEVKLAARDEKGALLENSQRECETITLVLGPRQSALGLASFHTLRAFLSAPLSDRFVVAPVERCATSERRVAYSGQYPAITGLDASQTLQITADDWSPARFHTTVSSEMHHAKGVVSTGWLWHDGNESAFDATGTLRPVDDDGEWDGTLYLTPPRHPVITAAGEASIWCSSSESSTLTLPCLDSQYVYRADDGFRLTEFRTPAPSTYVALPNETIFVGDGPMHAEPFVIVEPFMAGTYLQFRLAFRGSLGEEYLDGAVQPFTVTDSTGVIRTATGINGIALGTPGPFAIEATRQVSMRGIDGSATMRVTFDSNAADPLPPLLTSLRVLEHDGRHVSNVVAGDRATLVFSAVDTTPETAFAAIRAETMTVRWRTHGTTEWNALPSSVVSTEIANTPEELAALGHRPTGTTFHADLTPITTAGPAAIDLTLRFEDAAGNAHEWTQSPAFTIEEPVRRRPVRH